MLLHTNPEVKLRYSIDRYQIRSKCWHFIKIQINNTSKLWRCLSDVLYQMTSFDLPMFIACKHKFPELMKSRLSMEKEQKYISRYYQHDMPKISNMIWLKNKILLNVNNVQQISLLDISLNTSSLKKIFDHYFLPTEVWNIKGEWIRVKFRVSLLWKGVLENSNLFNSHFTNKSLWKKT